MKSFSDLGLDKAGIKLIGSGNLTTDEELQGMGDVTLGKVTTYHYSVAADRPANKAFQAMFVKEYGDKVVGNFVTVAAWDAMDAIYTAIRAQGGKIDPDRTMELLRNYKNPNSPRGPISIDPETRDIVQNIYIREVRRVGNQLANVELETIPNVKDPWKEFNRGK
jgi:branched-chain amino acid transport system substrate-binding protein